MLKTGDEMRLTIDSDAILILNYRVLHNCALCIIIHTGRSLRSRRLLKQIRAKKTIYFKYLYSWHRYCRSLLSTSDSTTFQEDFFVIMLKSLPWRNVSPQPNVEEVFF